jgi:hypothetical protein
VKRLKDRAAAATGPNRASAFVDLGGYWLVGAIVYQRAKEVAKNFRKKLALVCLEVAFGRVLYWPQSSGFVIWNAEGGTYDL